MKRLTLNVSLICIIVLYWSSMAQAISTIDGYARFEEISAQSHPFLQLLSSDFTQECSLYTNNGYAYETGNGIEQGISIGDSIVSNGGDAGVHNLGYASDLYSIYNADIHLKTDNTGNNITIANVGYHSEIYGSVVSATYDPFLNGSAGDCGSPAPLFNFAFDSDSDNAQFFISAHGEAYLENITQGALGWYDFSIYGFGSLGDFNYWTEFNNSGYDNNGGWGFLGNFMMDITDNNIYCDFGRVNDVRVADGDLFLYKASYNLTVGLIDSQPVPEPSTIFLLVSGLVGLSSFRRKFKIS